MLDAFQTANELLEAAKIANRSVRRQNRGRPAPRQDIAGTAGPSFTAPTAERRTALWFPPLATRCRRRSKRRCCDRMFRTRRSCCCDYAKRDVTVTAACVGTFILAESGLLDGHRRRRRGGSRRSSAAAIRTVTLEDSSMIVQLGPIRHGGRGAGSHGSGALAGETCQPAAGVAGRAISHRRFTSVAIGVRADGSSGSRRSAGREIRVVGTRKPRAGVFVECRGEGCRVEQTHPRSPASRGARQSRRWSIYRPCGWSGPSISSRPHGPASTTLPHALVTPMASRCAPCSGEPSCRGQRDSRVRIAAKGPSPSVLPKRLDRFNRGSAPRGADRRTDTNDRNGQHGPDIRDPVGVRRSIQEMRHNP